MLRGGSWNNNENNVRAANRNRNNPDNWNNNNGFRCARLPSQKVCRRECRRSALPVSARPAARAWRASAGCPRLAAEPLAARQISRSPAPWRSGCHGAGQSLQS